MFQNRRTDTGRAKEPPRRAAAHEGRGICREMMSSDVCKNVVFYLHIFSSFTNPCYSTKAFRFPL